MSSFLSKSKYLNGLQCPRLIWIQIHEPEKIPETDTATQHVFDQGHLVGELAKQLFPEGIDLSQETFMGNISKTKDLFRARVPLFEAGIKAGNIYSRLDILSPAGERDWDIMEVKASTSVKDVHIADVAFQRYCCIQAGLKIDKCRLILINNEYVKKGKIDPKGFFKIHDITAEVAAASAGIQDRIDGIMEVIGRETCPEMMIGPHCKDPYECALTDCWDGLPEHNVFSLYHSGKKAFELYNKGIITIAEIAEGYKLNHQQTIQKACVISGQPHVDKKAIREFLAGLEYPLYFFDFETIAPVVPLFDGTRPYQNVPFQYSLHVVRDEFSGAEHHSFLHTEAGDPRPALLSRLCSVIGDTGTVLAYNKSFEEGILQEMATAFPEHRGWIENVCGRMVDLLVPFRAFAYYHPAQKGSASLKAVLPAITGQGYADLEIGDGQTASILYLSVMYGEKSQILNPKSQISTNAKNQKSNAIDRAKVMRDLEEYCGRDTEGMIWIVERLGELGENNQTITNNQIKMTKKAKTKAQTQDYQTGFWP